MPKWEWDKRLETGIDERRIARDRRKLFNTLKQSEERYRTLMENLPVSVYRISYNEPVRILNANISAALMYGFDPIGLLFNASPDDLYYDPDDRKQLFSDIVDQKRIKNRIIQFKKISGEPFWGSLSAICHFDNNGLPNWVDCVVEDITERIIIEEKLSGYLKFFETLVDTISSPVFYKDINGRYLGCNRHFADVIIGLPRDDIINKTVFELGDAVPGKTAEMYAAQDRALFANPGLQEYESRVKCADGKIRNYRFSKNTYTDKDGNIAGIVEIMMDISAMVEKESDLKKVNEELEVLLTSLPSIVIGVSTNDRITHWNRFAEDIFGIKSEDVIGKRFYEAAIKWNSEIIYEAIGNCVLNEKSIRVEDLKFENPEGKIGVLGLTINPLKRGGDVLEGFMILGKDVTEQKILERQLLQSNKLEAIGQLAAGVAHEINTPMQYVGDNLKFINKSFVGLVNMLDVYERACTNAGDPVKLAEIFKQGEELSRKIKLTFLLEELPKALDQSLEGVVRVSKIVQSMKAFSHPGTGNRIPADINRAIESTVTVSRNEWKYDAELQLELEPDLPQVPCFESEFNQVILNLIVNARDAIHEAKEKGHIGNGIIKVKTMRENSHVVIRVEDNGMGIPAEVREKIFDPFFTTKEVGKGTGQGLPISHSIIVEKHNGLLYFESEIGKGTVFIIKLPIEEEE